MISCSEEKSFKLFCGSYWTFFKIVFNVRQTKIIALIISKEKKIKALVRLTRIFLFSPHIITKKHRWKVLYRLQLIIDRPFGKASGICWLQTWFAVSQQMTSVLFLFNFQELEPDFPSLLQDKLQSVLTTELK